MSSLADVFVRVRPDTKGFGPELSRGVGKASDDAGHKAGKGFTSGWGKGIKGVAAATAGAFGVIKVTEFAAKTIADSLGEARESIKVGKLTEQVIKTTGGAARVSAKDIEGLANSISRKTGIDDEAIQSGENLLLTFTNVRNEVGKGNDIFNQATGLMQDMSVALGQDTKSSAIQLGKALNDPIKGVTALQRVGVSFTQSQRDQIKALVEAGNTMGAQKLILAELSKEFGGAAAVAATPADKARVAWKNFEEEIGKKLLPLVDRLATWFATDGIRMLEDFGSAISEVAANVIQHIREIKGHWAEMQLKIAGAKQFFRDLKQNISDLWTGIKDAFREGARQVVMFFLDMVGKVLHGAAVAFGWVPIIGDKLRTAAGKFDKFKDDVNRSLSKVKDKDVTLRAKFEATKGPGGWVAGIKLGARGGKVEGGVPGKDSVPYLLMPGEFIVDREGRNLPDALGHYGVPGMATGGVVPRRGLRLLPRLPSAATIDRRVGAKFVEMFKAVGERAMEALAETGIFSGASGMGGVGSGVTRWSGLVLRVLTLLHQSASWLGTVLQRMQRESGGNPNAINLWDSNARAGTPSIGLMQVIGPTFRAYGNGFIGRGIYDPLANIFAGLNYAIHRYGSLAALSRPGGYDAGGILQPGALGLNSTGRPERVLSPAQTALFERLLARLEGTTADRALTVLRLHPDDIRAIGAELRRGMDGANFASGRAAGLYGRIG